MALYVLDSAQNAIGVIGSFTNDQHVQDISLGGSTFTFDVNKDEDCAKYLKTGNYLIMQDNLSRNWAFYILRTVADQQVITVTSCDAGITLINRMMDVDNETTPQPIEYYVNNIIKGTQWTIGANEISDMKEALQLNNRETGLQRLLNVLQGFNHAEVEFEVELSGLHVTKWLLNIRKQLGTVRNDLEIDYNDTLTDIIKTEDRSSFVTALEGTSQNTSSTAPKKDDKTAPKGALSFAAVSGKEKVIADAKRYLGIPYRWGGAGGARGGDPKTGMDCSSFVSQVYKDFGINIPAYTVSMEKYGYDIPMSQVQTGDMLFYGSHGASYHIALALDNKNMIFEPEPGESCKEEPISDFPPSWAERNSQMAAIVEGTNNTQSSQSNNSQADSQASQPADSDITLNNTTYSDADYFLSGGWLYAKTNNNLYNNGNPYIESFFDDSTATSAQELLNDTLQQLKTVSVPAVSYQCNVAIVDPTLKLGDTVRIVDHTFNPPCYLQARVIQLTRSYSDNSQNQVVFGNFQEIQSKISNSLKNLQGEIQSLKNGISANASDISNVSSTVTDVTSAVGVVSSQVQKVISGIDYHTASIDSAISQAGGHGNTNYYGNALQSGTDFKKGDLDFVTDDKGVTTIYVWNGTKWEKLVDDSDTSQVSAIVASAEKAVQNMQGSLNNKIPIINSKINSLSSVSKSMTDQTNSMVSTANSLVTAVSSNGLEIKSHANALNIYDTDISKNTNSISTLSGSMTTIQDNLNTIQTTVADYKKSTNEEISTIKQNANQIQANVVDNQKNLKIMESDISQNKNTISATIQQTINLNNKINIINYVANSELIMNMAGQNTNPDISKPSTFKEPYCWHSTGFDVSESTYNGQETLVITYDGDTSLDMPSSWTSDPIARKGKVFSSSIEIVCWKFTNDMKICVNAYDSNDTIINTWNYQLDKTQTGVWQTATIENAQFSDNTIYLRIHLSASPQSIDEEQNLILEVYQPMLTFTSKLFPYVPSQTDLVQNAINQTNISNIKETVNQFSVDIMQNTQKINGNEQKLTTFNTSISGINATVADVNNKYTTLSQKVDSFDIQIDQIKNNNLSGTQIITEINASPTGVLIQGKYIHLDGQTVIDKGIIKDADIASLSADKITSGTIDAGTINVVNINGANIQAHTIGANQLIGNDVLVSLQKSLTYVDIQPDSITILKDAQHPIIQLNTTGLMINGDNNQQVFKLDQSGITVSNPVDSNNSMIGLFHVNHIYQHPEWAGIDLDLNPDYGGKYIGFGCYHDKTQFYDLEFGYTEDPDIFNGSTGIIMSAPVTNFNQFYFQSGSMLRVPGVGTQIVPTTEKFTFNNHYYTGIGFVTNNGGNSNGFIFTDQGEPFFVRYNTLYPLKGILQTEGYPGF